MALGQDFQQGTESPGHPRRLSYSCQAAQEWPQRPVGIVAVGESKGLWKVLNVQSKKLIFSFFRMCHRANCLHISAASAVWGGLLQSGTVMGDPSVSGIRNRSYSGGAKLEMMLNFLQRFLFDQCWKEQVFLEMACVL